MREVRQATVQKLEFRNHNFEKNTFESKYLAISYDAFHINCIATIVFWRKRLLCKVRLTVAT